MKIFILLGVIFSTCLEEIHGKSLSELDVDFTDLIEKHLNEKLDRMNVELDKIQDSLNEMTVDVNNMVKFEHLMSPLAVTDRHDRNQNGIGVAVDAFTVQNNDCGQKVVTQWVTQLADINTNKPGTLFGQGVFRPISGAGFYFVYGNVQCAQGSTCDMTFRLNGVTNIGAMGNRFDCPGFGCDGRWTQMSMGFVHRFALSTDTMDMFMQSGNPNNCIRDGGWRAGRFAVIIIIFQ